VHGNTIITIVQAITSHFAVSAGAASMQPELMRMTSMLAMHCWQAKKTTFKETLILRLGLMSKHRKQLQIVP